MKKYNLILHSTTSCNFNCSYCDVIKDKKNHDLLSVEKIINFLNKNFKNINRFKFFGGEPLLAWKNIKNIIENTHLIIGNKFEIVTNTSLLNDENCSYFEKYFEIIFFSIDSENVFDYEKVFDFINKYNLKDKVYFNLIISPAKEEFAYKQFEKLYNSGFKNFNILPVYYTKIWEKEDLKNLSIYLKKIIDKSLLDNEIKLYGFQSNDGYNVSLIKESLFIDIDLKVYYSDFVSTYIGSKIKNELFLGKLDDFSFEGIDISKKEDLVVSHENNIISKVKGQKELHKIMDYFSKYLNEKGVIKD